MKKILIWMSVILFAVVAYSFAGVTPPKVVTDAFKTKFPKATDVEWGMEGKTEYEAEFKLDGKDVSANFKVDGSWTETEASVEKADLPAGVMEYMKKNVPDADIKETAKIDSPTGSVYEVEVKGLAYLFDMSGKFIKSSKD